jgi:hypothetical protein
MLLSDKTPTKEVAKKIRNYIYIEGRKRKLEKKLKINLVREIVIDGGSQTNF